jgi:hypothetical protein
VAEVRWNGQFTFGDKDVASGAFGPTEAPFQGGEVIFL